VHHHLHDVAEDVVPTADRPIDQKGWLMLNTLRMPDRQLFCVVAVCAETARLRRVRSQRGMSSFSEAEDGSDRFFDMVGEEESDEVRAQAANEDDDLRLSLAGMSQLATARMELADVLTRVAEYAVKAIPGADGAGLTLLDGPMPRTIVASEPFVAQVDAIQYQLDEGPCITAAMEGRTVRSDSLEQDVQWPRFGPKVARLGVHSVVSLPLTTTEGTLGALNVYAHANRAFDDYAVLIGELFAVPAAVAVQNAQVLATAKRLADQLQTALTSRATIDQALGVVMSRVGCGPDEAFARLRAISQRENRRLAAVAQELLDDAIGRARARHAHPDS
jgi:putative methionine-R-sulfoxide reductase with GAF domain